MGNGRPVVVRREEDATDGAFSASLLGSSVGAAMAVVSLFLLVVVLVLMGPMRAAQAQDQQEQQPQEEEQQQPADDAQEEVHCGPWEVEPRVDEATGEQQYWNFRWCYDQSVEADPYQDFAGYSLGSPEETTVQETAAGDNNYPGQGEAPPMVYQQVDSRSDFREGFYRHVVDCPRGYKAIGGGFDLNTPDQGQGAYWTILASRPLDDKRGDSWAVDAYGYPKFLRNPPTFTAYAACAREDLLDGLRYEREDAVLAPNENNTIWPTCGRNRRAIGGGFDFGVNTNLKLVRSERAREGERAWGSGAKNVPEGRREPATVWAWTVCVFSSALEASEYQEASDRAARPSSLRAVANTPRCPEGTYLLSGGAGMPNNNFDSNTGYPFWSQSNFPGVGENYWRASGVLRDGEVTVHAFALCGKFAGQ